MGGDRHAQTHRWGGWAPRIPRDGVIRIRGGHGSTLKEIPATLSTFLAIDFETANEDPGSACGVAVVEVQALSIVSIWSSDLSTNSTDFRFSVLHGITPERSAAGRSFQDAWSEIEPMLRRCGCRVVAHNAKFDRRVLETCARRHRIRLPRIEYTCTRHLAEAVWGLRPADLRTVCTHLAIPLDHHNARSDAVAAARIAIASDREKLRRMSAEVQS